MTDSTSPFLSGPPPAGDEVATLTGSLERMRRIFEWKCAGLDTPGLRTRIGASSLTLGGLLKHVTMVEEHQFSHKFLGEEMGPPWSGVDWDADPDWEFRTAADDSPEELLGQWRQAVIRARAIIGEALADGGLDQLARLTRPDGNTPSLRRLIIDMVEEYARHVGHADLLREAVDGSVGEDPPD